MCISTANFCVFSLFCYRFDLFVSYLGVLIRNALLQLFEHGCKYRCFVITLFGCLFVVVVFFLNTCIVHA